MPAMIYYTVTQSREVKVRAQSPEDAISIASRAFRGDPDNEYLNPGSTLSEVKEVSLSCYVES